MTTRKPDPAEQVPARHNSTWAERRAAREAAEADHGGPLYERRKLTLRAGTPNESGEEPGVIRHV